MCQIVHVCVCVRARVCVRVRGASPPSLPPATVLATDALQTVINLDAATPFSVETNFS